MIEAKIPPSTSPPSPRAPPTGLFTSSPAPLDEGTVTKRRQTPSTVDTTVEKAALSLFPCDQCDYTNASEKGLRQHKRMKHGKSQMDAQLPPSSLSTPESLRQPTSYSNALVSSPIKDSARAIPCNNCDQAMSPSHTYSTYTCCACDEIFNSEDELDCQENTVHPHMCCFKRLY